MALSLIILSEQRPLMVNPSLESAQKKAVNRVLPGCLSSLSLCLISRQAVDTEGPLFRKAICYFLISLIISIDQVKSQ